MTLILPFLLLFIDLLQEFLDCFNVHQRGLASAYAAHVRTVQLALLLFLSNHRTLVNGFDMYILALLPSFLSNHKTLVSAEASGFDISALQLQSSLTELRHNLWIYNRTIGERVWSSRKYKATIR